jgi:endonuclease-3
MPAGGGRTVPNEAYFSDVVGLLRSALTPEEAPSVTRISREKRDPFRVLVSTMISLRTKDEVASAASARLFARADSPDTIAKLSEKEIADLIYPAGFYRTKAAHISSVAAIVRDRYGGCVPASREELLALPGVGAKTANLTLNLGFGIDAICVDTHVHRIANRMGWVKTRSPDETETALRAVLPKRYWIEINGLLVSFGKRVCTPVSPWCSRCPVEEICPKRNVSRCR